MLCQLFIDNKYVNLIKNRGSIMTVLIRLISGEN